MLSAEIDFLESDPSELNEEDLSVARTNAVVTATDWTTETILGQLKRGNIELTPRFQRREAWTDGRKSAFIESLFLGLPVPQIVLAERNDKKGSYIVIDGKQRLLSIRRFGVEDRQEEFEPLTLVNLNIRLDLNRRTWIDLKNDPTSIEDINSYENQTIRTVVVRNWPDESFLYLVFLRLNTGSVPLSTQELRQALHPGPFTNFVDDYSSESTSLQNALSLKAPDFRMRDVEILIRFYAFSEFIHSYKGNLKSFLDDTSQHFNEAWSTQQERITSLAKQCDDAIDRTIDIFGDHAFRRWVSDRYEPRFNRAVFDIMAYYFSDRTTAELAVGEASSVENAYKHLCDNNEEFNNSLQSTTKSIGATFTRLRVWGNALKEVLNSDINIPKPAPGTIL